ncbi:MAG: hypothetical protein QOD26_2114 [Betaproteobacteria bacterium]|jgi:hypothetical protein|nr:hypothetical protein [Betaproteobacteria bacterium]
MGALLLGSDVLRLEDARDLRVRVESGTVWITQERDTRDVMLRAGESFRFDRNGVALMSACGRIAYIRVLAGS